jgi:hypothetical protein
VSRQGGVLENVLGVELSLERPADLHPGHQDKVVAIPLEQPTQGVAVALLCQDQKKFGICAHHGHHGAPL